MASSLSDLRDSDVVGNNPVVPDSSREQVDLDQETNFTTDAGEVRPEIRSITCTISATRGQQHTWQRSQHCITVERMWDYSSSCRRRVPAEAVPNRQRTESTHGSNRRRTPTGKSCLSWGFTDCWWRGDFWPRDYVSTTTTWRATRTWHGNPNPEATSAQERELHMQDGVSPSPQAMNSRPLTRLRSQSAR